MTRRHVTFDSNQKSIVPAEFERRSWMYEDVEYTLAHRARHEFKLYKALSRKTIKRILETQALVKLSQLERKSKNVTEVGHQSTQKLIVVYQHGFWVCVPGKLI